jgi:hypothetical protein
MLKVSIYSLPKPSWLCTRRKLWHPFSCCDWPARALQRFSDLDHNPKTSPTSVYTVYITSSIYLFKIARFILRLTVSSVSPFPWNFHRNRLSLMLREPSSPRYRPSPSRLRISIAALRLHTAGCCSPSSPRSVAGISFRLINLLAAQKMVRSYIHKPSARLPLTSTAPWMPRKGSKLEIHHSRNGGDEVILICTARHGG